MPCSLPALAEWSSVTTFCSRLVELRRAALCDKIFLFDELEATAARESIRPRPRQARVWRTSLFDRPSCFNWISYSPSVNHGPKLCIVSRSESFDKHRHFGQDGPTAGVKQVAVFKGYDCTLYGVRTAAACLENGIAGFEVLVPELVDTLVHVP